MLCTCTKVAEHLHILRLQDHLPSLLLSTPRTLVAEGSVHSGEGAEVSPEAIDYDSGPVFSCALSHIMTTTRPIFDPVDTNFDANLHSVKDDVESPSLSDSNALARFEFEPGRSREGTKVLMVEWEEDDTTRAINADWVLSWEGKKTVLPAKDQESEAKGATRVNRLYFLLGPGISVPTQVRLQKGAITWRTNPLPAIFAPELGATARQAGKKGVLHTIWAKKRLQVLQSEIDAESKDNTEGIGLEMAIAEKKWIEQNFGVVSRPGNISIPTQGAMANLSGPASPRSPGGGRLMDKLKGLKLGTTTADLNGGAKESANDSQNPLSPESSDVAVGSFGSFAQLKVMPAPFDLAAKPAQAPQQQRKIVAQRPPDSFAAQRRQDAGMGSLNAFASSDIGFSSSRPDDDKEDGLFALPMSPRSPEMAKSPFSFGAQDTMKYARGERA